MENEIQYHNDNDRDRYQPDDTVAEVPDGAFDGKVYTVPLSDRERDTTKSHCGGKRGNNRRNFQYSDQQPVKKPQKAAQDKNKDDGNRQRDTHIFNKYGKDDTRKADI